MINYNLTLTCKKGDIRRSSAIGRHFFDYSDVEKNEPAYIEPQTVFGLLFETTDEVIEGLKLAGRPVHIVPVYGGTEVCFVPEGKPLTMRQSNVDLGLYDDSPKSIERAKKTIREKGYLEFVNLKTLLLPIPQSSSIARRRTNDNRESGKHLLWRYLRTSGPLSYCEIIKRANSGEFEGLSKGIVSTALSQDSGEHFQRIEPPETLIVGKSRIKYLWSATESEPLFSASKRGIGYNIKKRRDQLEASFSALLIFLKNHGCKPFAPAEFRRYAKRELGVDISVHRGMDCVDFATRGGMLIKLHRKWEAAEDWAQKGQSIKDRNPTMDPKFVF